MTLKHFGHRRHRQPKLLRRAAAVVELAVCLPVIVILVFGALEGANIMFCRQAMIQAAYEACKHASRADGTSARANRLAQDVLTARRVNAANVTLSPADVSTARVGRDVTVRITVNSSSRSFTGLGLFSGRLIDVAATMQKE